MSKADDYYASIRDDREAWRDEVEQVCMWCGETSNYEFEVHEIERRSHATGRWGERCNYLLLCRACHAGPVDSAKHDKQLACKMKFDPENYNLFEWLRIRDPELNAPDRVTLRDIVRYLRIDDEVFG